MIEKEGYMKNLDPRIRTALQSVNPTTKNPAWHGCPTALGVLRGVSPQVAVWRPYANANNIREIALHIAFYENSVANRISGVNMLVGFAQRKTGWANLLETIDEKQWKEELEILKRSHERLVQAVLNFDPGMLGQPVEKNTDRSAVELIHGVAEHSLYHTAQIEMLKTLAKQQGLR